MVSADGLQYSIIQNSRTCVCVSVWVRERRIFFVQMSTLTMPNSLICVMDVLNKTLSWHKWTDNVLIVTFSSFPHKCPFPYDIPSCLPWVEAPSWVACTERVAHLPRPSRITSLFLRKTRYFFGMTFTFGGWMAPAVSEERSHKERENNRRESMK